jgi:CheY-like chemotaxis protein
LTKGACRPILPQRRQGRSRHAAPTHPRRRRQPGQPAVFADALDALGFDGTLAPDGARAIAEADARAFDALLLDVHMPTHGGVDVLAHVRAGGGPSRDAIALATSAETNVETIAALRAAGFAEVLAKPIGVDALRVALAASADHA